MKRLKKSLAFIVSISMLATLSACNSNDKESSKEETTTEATTEEITENIEEYKSKILDFNNNVYEAALLLSNAGKYERNYWENLENIGGTVDFDKVYINALDWLIENADEEYNVTETKLSDDYKAICTSYSEITSMGIDSAEVSPINDAYQELFNDYCMLYVLVTEPSGSLSNFIDNYNDYIDNIKNNTTLLTTLLEWDIPPRPSRGNFFIIK